MERVPNKRSLILLGSTGFLGSSILKTLKSEQLLDLDVLVSHSSPFNTSTLFTLLEPNFAGGDSYNTTNLASVLNLDLVVINCAASRNSKVENLSAVGNFVFPKMVLDTLMAIQGIRIKWIQLETFWQYSKKSTPDGSYVLWKNRFGNLLTESSVHGNLCVEKLVLPHLIGPFDNPLRFLPRLFSRILAGESVYVYSPDEVFCLADVRDVAQYLVSILSNSRSEQDLFSALFPFIEIRLRDIVYLFKEISGSASEIQLIETLENSNPVLNLSEQPTLLNSDQLSLHGPNSTFSDIARWLSAPQHIANL